jgi:hypothetical protein
MLMGRLQPILIWLCNYLSQAKVPRTKSLEDKDADGIPLASYRHFSSKAGEARHSVFMSNFQKQLGSINQSISADGILAHSL